MASNEQGCTSPNSGLPCRKTSDFAKRQNPAECQPFLRSAIERYADRRGDLDERQRVLNDKIGIMERSIPALMALSMLQTERGPGDALGRVRALMDRLAPRPDPADELAAELAQRVEQLNRETEELHDKIINADVQLEENCMKLQSLEQVNRELEDKIQGLEKKLESCFSLEPISSDDRLCLAKIRKLGEEEMRLKRSIQDYEERELALRCQIEKILGPNESKCRKICGGLQSQRHHVHKSKHQMRRDCPGSEMSSDVESIFERKQNCNTGCSALRHTIDQKGHATCKCQKKLENPCSQRKRPSEKVSKSCPHHGHRQSDKHLSRLCNCNKVKKRKSCKESEGDDDARDSAWCVTKQVPEHVPERVPENVSDHEIESADGTTILDLDYRAKLLNVREDGTQSAVTLAMSKFAHSAILSKNDKEWHTSQSTHTKILSEINNDLQEEVLSVMPQDD